MKKYISMIIVICIFGFFYVLRQKISTKPLKINSREPQLVYMWILVSGILKDDYIRENSGVNQFPWYSNMIVPLRMLGISNYYHSFYEDGFTRQGRSTFFGKRSDKIPFVLLDNNIYDFDFDANFELLVDIFGHEFKTFYISPIFRYELSFVEMGKISHRYMHSFLPAIILSQEQTEIENVRDRYLIKLIGYLHYEFNDQRTKSLTEFSENDLVEFPVSYGHYIENLSYLWNYEYFFKSTFEPENSLTFELHRMKNQR